MGLGSFPMSLLVGELVDGWMDGWAARGMVVICLRRSYKGWILTASYYYCTDLECP